MVHGLDLSPMTPIAYPDDLVAIMADVDGLQSSMPSATSHFFLPNLPHTTTRTE